MVILEAGRLTPSAGDSAQWQVSANVPETSVVHLEVGQEVDCLADAFPGRDFKGKVTWIDDAPQPGLPAVTYNVVVQVTNPGLRFRDGMSVRLSFVVTHRSEALRIPARALLFRSSGDPRVSEQTMFGLSPNELAMPDAAERTARTVWVARGNSEPEPVRIQIGITDGTLTEVVAGLNEGERVVIDKTDGALGFGGSSMGAGPRADNNTVGFSPVVERGLKARDECFLDLDTGQTHGPVIIGGESDLPPGMDLSVPSTPVGSGFRAEGVVALEHLQVQSATPADWDMKPEELGERIKTFPPRVVGGSPGPTELANRQSELPSTYLFRTPEGNEGVLQIVAFTGDPTGVRLRYKMTRVDVARD
jgi:hypothetical protein